MLSVTSQPVSLNAKVAATVSAKAQRVDKFARDLLLPAMVHAYTETHTQTRLYTTMYTHKRRTTILHKNAVSLLLECTEAAERQRFNRSYKTNSMAIT